MADDKKFAGFICTGCGIGERLDAGQLETTAKRDGKMASCQQHEMLCSKEGVQLIRNAIDSDGATHVMIAACSRRAKVEAFSFPDVAMSRANLREGVIWARPDTDEARETTQDMADDYIRMACAEVKFMTKPKVSGEQALNKTILVVGGGVTGMTAALETAAAGFPVHIVEKTGALGGWAAKWHKRIPGRAAADGVANGTNVDLPMPQDNDIADMIAAVEANELITVHLNSTVTKTSGAPGRFSADITTESGGTATENFGAIIQASGWKEFDASAIPSLGSSNADVVSNVELEALAREAGNGPIKRPSDGKEVKSVVFVQNAGQASSAEGHLPYHSGIGDLIAIKQAMYFKAQNGKDCDTTILFDNLRTPGAAGEDFYRSGQQQMVIFSKGQVGDVTSSGNGATVNFKDLILDEDVALQADLVVLDLGMVPNSGPDPYAVTVALEKLPLKERDGKKAEIEAQVAAASVSIESILNLDYRQGTDLPHLSNGFTDSHFICFPYETRRTGIYACGPVRRPMDIKQAQDDATGAAMKAIQAAVNAGQGSSAHPRVGDLSYPSFRKEGCTQCKRCTVECPFGAINEDEKRYPQFNESRCRRCGTCMGACPVRVISFENYSIDTVGQQIKAVDMPDEFSEKPRILVMACENDAYPALDQAAMSGQEISPWARIVPVRCLGSVSLSWVTDAMNSGYDGIVMMGCQRGDDYQCHFVRGSAMAAERMAKVGDTLSTLNLEPERVVVHEVAITDIERAPRLIKEMEEVVEKVGMSPFKF
ncbi:MAG: hydrogenase iron-sulfur subunit [Gammaproteobacteria bacterium]|nr:hydrogenase iron-sulfur subunit [Gammaproteobacteria bacterium]